MTARQAKSERMIALNSQQPYQIPASIIHGLVWERVESGCTFKFALIVREDLTWSASVLALPKGGVDEWICSGHGLDEQHAKTSAFNAMLAMCDAGEARLRAVADSLFEGKLAPYHLDLFAACVHFSHLLRSNQAFD